MAEILTVAIRGERQVAEMLEAMARINPRAAQLAVRTEAELEMTEMKERTPVDLGNLMGTGRVEEVQGIGVRWAFGGLTGKTGVFVDYAVEVHENLDVFHTTGQAKYMESVLAESMPHLANRIGRRWALELGL